MGNRKDKNHNGGIIHVYQKYDPIRFPSPTTPPPDMVSSAFDHMLQWGNARQLTAEQLAKAIKLEPEALKDLHGFGPSLESLIAILEAQREEILTTYESNTVLEKVWKQYDQFLESTQPPDEFRERFFLYAQGRQIYDLERLWYDQTDERSDFARTLVQMIDALSQQYQIEDLYSRYEFSGASPLEIEHAIEIKESLEKIDELLEQLRRALENAQIYTIDMESLAEFVEQPELDDLSALQQQVQDHLRELAEQQGIQSDADGRMNLTPQAYKTFQGKLLQRIFDHLESSKTGRHESQICGEGSVELQQVKPYEFGDSMAHMDLPQSLINAVVRHHSEELRDQPLRIQSDDIVVHQMRNSPKCATSVIMDMSGSMRYEGQYINVKKMALALQGLITSEYPGDHLSFIEMYTHARQCQANEIINLLPKPVTIHDPVVRYKIDMSNTRLHEHQLPPHFTNIQHALQLARLNLATVDTPNRQIVLITDGLPTAHYSDEWLYLLYPPDPLTDDATMREAMRCKQDGITINFFLIPSWSQTEEDIQFAYRVAESTEGRVFFTAGSDLDRFVVWDYLSRKREIL
ncbi:MAG: hypothetical protein CMJ82_13325 [Planctomycetaceae bacterium]|nr:hypothetical protein [Planctomycetaceae bacterium]|tara:strand:- start:2793 stop:4523 length:1731 start_codon:yes stop_codon:yes gene_type:complete